MIYNISYNERKLDILGNFLIQSITINYIYT